VTLVALPAEQRFGAPQVFSVGGRPRFLALQATGEPAPPPAGEGGTPGPRQDAGAFRDQLETKDAGVLPGPAP